MLTVRGIPCRDTNYRPSCCTTAVVMRPGTSDEKVFKHVFIRGEYSFLYGLKSLPQTVLDGGANCGYASIIFALLFPRAKIVAVEASRDNARALRRNLRAANLLDRVAVANKGLWYRTAQLSLSLKGKQIVDDTAHSAKWSFRVVEATKYDRNAIAAVTILELAASHKVPNFDFVKLDVEGAENDIFRGGVVDWLAETSLLSVEVHEKIYPNLADKISRQVLPYLGKHYLCSEYHVWSKSTLSTCQKGVSA
ncbi:methyltransferase [Pseudoscourfieldia marina]